MRSQLALRAAFRRGLTASRGQGSGWLAATAAVSFPQNAAAYGCSTPSRLRLRPASAVMKTTTTTPTPTTPSHFFSTSTPRPPSSEASTALSSSSSNSTAASAAASAATPAPVLPASVLSHILFAPSSSSPSSSSSSPDTTTAAVATVASKHPSVYATVHIHGRPYLVTPGDSLRLPFRMPGVQPGDELLLNRVGVMGNRMVTAVSSASEEVEDGGRSFGSGSHVAHVPGASVKAVVLGVETEPLRTLVKKKRRTRRKRTVKSKHHFTVLRIQELVVEEQ